MEVSEEKISYWLLIFFVWIVSLVVISAFGSWDRGYEWGQRDALEGKYWYQLVQGQDGQHHYQELNKAVQR